MCICAHKDVELEEGGPQISSSWQAVVAIQGGYWELKPAPLQEQSTLLTPEPLQVLLFFKKVPTWLNAL